MGGSKKHGGGDLGPTRAKQAWAELGVDGLGIADAAPGPDADPALAPRLTCEMVARLQGWRDEWDWRFSGRKTARYRQIGNAFPPPVAEAVGTAIRRALEHAGSAGSGGFGWGGGGGCGFGGCAGSAGSGAEGPGSEGALEGRFGGRRRGARARPGAAGAAVA